MARIGFAVQVSRNQLRSCSAGKCRNLIIILQYFGSAKRTQRTFIWVPIFPQNARAASQILVPAPLQLVALEAVFPHTPEFREEGTHQGAHSCSCSLCAAFEYGRARPIYDRSKTLKKGNLSLSLT